MLPEWCRPSECFIMMPTDIAYLTDVPCLTGTIL